MPDLSNPASLPITGRVQVSPGTPELFTVDAQFSQLFVYGETAGVDLRAYVDGADGQVLVPAQTWMQVWQRPPNIVGAAIDYTLRVKPATGTAAVYVGYLAW